MVQEHVPIGSDQARADVVDVEEGLSKWEREPPPLLLPLPLPVQLVVTCARQRGSRHHHDDHECPGRNQAGNEQGKRGDVRDDDRPRHRIEGAVEPLQLLPRDRAVHLAADLREQAFFVAEVQVRQILPRVKIRSQQERGYPELRQDVICGGRSGSICEFGKVVQLAGILDLVLREDLLQPGWLGVIGVEQGADIAPHGLREPG